MSDRGGPDDLRFRAWRLEQTASHWRGQLASGASASRLPEPDEQWERTKFEAYRKAAKLESMVPEPAVRPDGTKPRKPCIAVGIVADRNGRLYSLVAASGYGVIPEEVEPSLDPENDVTVPKDDRRGCTVKSGSWLSLISLPAWMSTSTSI